MVLILLIYLTLQNRFLEDLRIFLLMGNLGVGKKKLPFQQTVPPKSL